MGKIRERIIAYILAFCTLVSAVCTGITMPVFAEEDGTQSSFTVSNFTIEIWNEQTKTYEPLTPGMTVKEGASLSVRFDWALADGATSTYFTVDIGDLSGIQFLDSTHWSLPHIGYDEDIGEYWIEDNKIHIQLKEGTTFLTNSKNRNGGATVNGEVHFDGKKDGEKVDIQIGETIVRDLIYSTNTPESGAKVEKSAVDYLFETTDDGKTVYRQKYQIKIYTWNGEVTITSFDDVLGAGLNPESMSKLTVTEISNCNLFDKDQSYSLEEVKSILKDAKLGADGQAAITFEYTVDVNAEDVEGALALNPEDKYKNKASLIYKNNKEHDGGNEAEANVRSRHPSITKSVVSVDEDGKKITWRITVNLNGTKWEDIESIIEYPGAGLDERGNGEGIPLDLMDPTKFKETPEGSGIYVYDYVTTISKDYAESIKGKTITNEVVLTEKNGSSQKAQSSTTLSDKNWIEKVAEGATKDAQGNVYINWKVTMRIPDGVKDVRLADYVETGYPNGQHEIDGDIYARINHEDPKIRIITDVKMNGHILEGTPVDTDIVSKIDWEGIHFADNLAGHTVEVFYRTKVTDGNVSGKVFVNKVEAKYDEYDESGTKKEHEFKNIPLATWESNSAVSKDGTAGSDGKTVNYVLKVDLTKINLPKEIDPQDNRSIILEDLLPEGLELDKSVQVTIQPKAIDQWNNVNGLNDYALGYPEYPTVDADSSEEGKITFKVKITEGLLTIANLRSIKDYETNTPYLYIYYTLKIKDMDKFVKEGKPQDFTNSVSGTFGDEPIGEDSITTRLTPKPVVSKGATYTGPNPEKPDSQGTAPYVYYEVEVNKDAVDLSTGSLHAEDQLGSALAYDLTSIQVFEIYEEGGQEKTRELESGNQYKYTYNAKANSLSFTLPDATHLKITYRALVLLEYVEPPQDPNEPNTNPSLGADNARNTFSLSGEGFNGANSENTIISPVIKPFAWATGDTASVSIYKYYIKDDSIHALSGAEFRIVAVQETASGWEETGDPEEILRVDEKGTVTQSGFVREQVYKLEEITAPAGYALGDPIYFVITNSTDTEEWEAKGVEVYAPGEAIAYENFPSTLVITKTVTGDDVSKDAAEQSLQFTVTKKGASGEENTIVYQGYLSDFRYDEETKIWTKELNLPPGEYIVEETAYDITGKELTSVSYTVSNSTGESTLIPDGSPVEGAAATVTVTEGGRVTVAYEDVYENKVEAAGRLTLTKTIAGGPTWHGINETMSFVISYEGEAAYAEEFPMTIRGDDPNWDASATSATYTLDNLPPGTYTVEEIVSDKVTSGKEYVLTKVTYQIGGGDLVECSTDAEHKITSAVSVTNEEPASVTFTNTYAANEGSLTLQKEVEDILDGEGHPVSGEAAWNAVKESLTFVVSKYDIEKNDYVPYRTIVVKDIPESWKIDSQGYAVLKLEGLPVGKYKVEERSGNLDDYTVQKTVYAVVPSDAESLYEEAKSTETGDLEVKRDQNITVTFTNTYSRNMADLVLEKTIEGLPGADNPEKQQEVWNMVREKLEFVITDKSADGTEAITVKGTHEDWHYDNESGSYKITISLPPGTYEVTETVSDLSDYTWKSASYTVTVTDKDNAVKQGSAQSGNTENRENITVSGITLATDDTATVSISNTYERNKGTLILTKKIVGLDAEQIEKLFTDEEKITFTIENIDTQEEFSYTCTLADFKPGQEEGTYTLTLNGENMLPTGTYRIKESNFDISDYETTVTFNVTQPNNNQGPSGVYNPENPPAFDIAMGDDTEVTFTNTYTAIPGTLILQKTINGDSDLAWDEVWDSLRFEVKDSSGNQVNGSPFSFTEKSNNTITLQLAPGVYTVTESATKDGYTCETTYTVNNKAAEPDSEGKVTVTIASSQNSTVEIKNNYVQDKGNLTIVKLLEGVSYDLAESKITFTVTNTSTRETFDSPYVLSDFTEDELQQGRYTLTIEDLPVGNYTVEETISTIDGYVITSVAATYTVIGGDETTQTTNGGVPDTAPEVEIKKDENTTVTYQNIYEEIIPDTGRLVIQKTVVGEKTWDEVKGILKFEVSGGDIEGVLSINAAEFQLVDGVYTYSIPNRTPGDYTVKEIIYGQETNYSRITTYTVGSADTTGLPYEEIGVEVVVPAGGDNTVAFTNNYSLDRGNLTITKTVDGPLPEADIKKITFTVTGPGENGTTYNESFTLGDNEFRFENGKYILKLENLLVGEYTVTETNYDFNDFITKEVSYRVNMDGEVKLVENGEEKSKDPAKVTVVKAEEGQDQTATVAYKDVYILEPKGSLVLEKRITGARGWAQINKNISFEVKLGNKVIGTYRLEVFNDDDGDGIYTYTIPNLALGTYTVTEIISNDENEKGYTRTTSYQVNDGDPETGNLTAEIELEEGLNNKVTFTNDYERDMGTLVITKTIYGAISKDKIKAALSFKVTDTETDTSTTYSLESFKGENGVYTLELAKPTGTYQITEIVTDISGWIWKETTYTIDGSGEKSGFTSTVQVNKGAETKVAYTNRYEENAGSLVIQKLVTKQDPNDSVISWNYVKDYLTFVITDENGETTEIKPKDVDFIGPDGNNMYYYIVPGLEAGKKYTVTETSSVPNYSCTVTYTSEGNVERLSETEARVTVDAEGAKITFTNTYKKKVETPPQQNTQTPSTPSQSQTQSTPAPTPGIQMQVDPTPTPKPSYEDGTVLSAERDRVPKTGDSFAMWLAFFLISLSSLMGYLLYLDKKNRKENKE